MRNILLLTATIAPRARASDLKHVDPVARSLEYQQALRFYLREVAHGTFDRLVFVDNSGHPLDDIERIVVEAGLTNRVNLVSFDGNSDADLGRFYLELGLLAEALDRAPLVDAAPNDRIWKVTGRYVIENVRALVETAPATADAYINCRNHPMRWADFYIAAFTKPAFQQLFADREWYHRPLTAGEVILREKLDDPSVVKGLTIAPRMRRLPKISGIRGYDGRSYSDWRNTLKYHARSVATRLMPKLWI